MHNYLESHGGSIISDAQEFQDPVSRFREIFNANYPKKLRRINYTCAKNNLSDNIEFSEDYNEYIQHAFDNLIDISIENHVLKYAQEVEESFLNPLG